MGTPCPRATDNDAYTVYDHLLIRNAVEFESIQIGLHQNAAACELADRTIMHDYSVQLDSVIGECIPFIIVELQLITDPIIVFPNPFTDHFKVYFPDEINSEENLTITDLSGRILYRYELTDFENGQDINISLPELNAGVFLITLKGDEYFSRELMMCVK